MVKKRYSDQSERPIHPPLSPNPYQSNGKVIGKYDLLSGAEWFWDWREQIFLKVFALMNTLLPCCLYKEKNGC